MSVVYWAEPFAFDRYCRSPAHPDSRTQETLTYLSVLNGIATREPGLGAILNSPRFKLPYLFVVNFGPLVYFVSSCFRTHQ